MTRMLTFEMLLKIRGVKHLFGPQIRGVKHLLIGKSGGLSTPSYELSTNLYRRTCGSDRAKGRE